MIDAMKELPTWVQIAMGLAGVMITSLATLQVAQMNNAPEFRSAAADEYAFIIEQLRQQVDTQTARIDDLQGAIEDLNAERREWQTDRYSFIQERVQLQQQVNRLTTQNTELETRVAELEASLAVTEELSGTDG